MDFSRRRLAGIGAGLILAAGGVFIGLAAVWTRPAAPSRGTPPRPSIPAASAPAAETRPAAWAVRLDRPGLPNLHRVSADLFRGAQPVPEGYRELVSLGIRTVVSLRSFHDERAAVEGAGMAYEHITMKAWHVEEHEAVRFLKIINDPARLPVFVHCQHGADRTGTMCALYRVVVGGWKREEAIAEMTKGGFGFHGIWENLVSWLWSVDMDKLREKAGVADPVTAVP
ncbi:MAG: tyrosine-protein phosphatase [Planctomycetota bacterium]